jgi:hypothetical protein
LNPFSSLVNWTVSKGVQTVQTGTAIVKKVPREAKNKIQSATHETLAALQTVLDLLSRQVPVEVSARFNLLKEAAFLRGEGENQITVFSSVATSSSKMLHEASSTIGTYVAKGETIPQQILSSTYANLHSVMDSLLILVHWKKNPESIIMSDIIEE